MTKLATDNLAELIRKKYQILTQLREIGLRQQKLVESSATAELLQLLGAKQHLIGALQIVERSLRPFQSEDPETRQWRSAADRDACAERADQCQGLLREVMQLERNQEAKMIERRDYVAHQLRSAGSAREAVGAYQQHCRPPHASPITDQALPSDHFDVTTGNS